jgi:hypothetical protein
VDLLETSQGKPHQAYAGKGRDANHRLHTLGLEQRDATAAKVDFIV